MTLKKLEKQALRSEQQALLSLLNESRAVDDIVGVMQFERKLAEVERALEELSLIDDTRASVALYFGGPKVVGMQGIQADFAGEILEDFQDLVSKSFARTEMGTLGARGPIAARSDTNLMVTNVTRGSFGFVLEEVGNQTEAFDTQLSDVVDSVAELIETVSSPQEEAFVDLVGEMDSRMVTATRNFFSTLSKAQATMKLVERDREVLLGRPEVERGRERTESLEVEEKEGVILVGVLWGLLPKHKRFEFTLADTGETISGKVSTDVSKAIGEQVIESDLNPLGKRWSAEFNVRDVRRPGQPQRTYYTLIRLRNEVV